MVLEDIWDVIKNKWAAQGIGVDNTGGDRNDQTGDKSPVGKK